MPRAKKIPTAVRKQMVDGARLPQMAELLDHFMDGAGGPQGVAGMLLTEYRAAKAGSITRQRILDSILRMIAQANQQMGGLEQHDLVDNADLERELARVVHQMPDEDELAAQEEVNPGDGPAGAGPVGPPA